MPDTEPARIAITADPISNSQCRFTVDRPVYEEGSFFFGSKEQAESSPLAARLFAIDGVKSALISHNLVTVTKSTRDDWPPTARQVGAAIRAHLATNEPAVSPAVREKLPPASEIKAKVQQVLDSEINPSVAMHGGMVRLIDVQGNSVYLQFGGGCQGCGMADVTLKQGIETAIRFAVPEVGDILDTTDHAAGRNPYYMPSRK